MVIVSLDRPDALTSHIRPNRYFEAFLKSWVFKDVSSSKKKKKTILKRYLFQAKLIWNPNTKAEAISNQIEIWRKTIIPHLHH